MDDIMSRIRDHRFYGIMLNADINAVSKTRIEDRDTEMWSVRRFKENMEIFAEEGNIRIRVHTN